MDKNNIGDMAWLDLTVDDAESVRDFYQQVIGWKSDSVSMGDYEDFVMLSPKGGDAQAGICHARGGNAELPPVWLPYFLVADIDQAVSAVEQNGGAMVTDIKSMGSDRYVIVKDPAGAHCALYYKG
ncbi:VOC family protein [Thalassotalea sp. HSM 43]|uniref:VOC family protein n=1 Tax=Thalassotalea sp. HSM 43 TaxID=2552945 RepID=UPI0010804291|nr:VOC family protein [Thalassotalea sp. HSM 43]QBY05728.1 VOC family protein [Thalassotalea sp. HSM 43]